MNASSIPTSPLEQPQLNFAGLWRNAQEPGGIADTMAGRRALFHSDWSGIDPKALPDNFLAIGDTPHDWLFPKPDMGLVPGGQRRQQIDEDHFGFEAWDCSHSSR